MNPLNVIRRRIAATTLANPSSFWQALQRGAVNGLRWAHLIALLAVGIGVGAFLVVIVSGVARVGFAPFYESEFWENFFRIQFTMIGFYLVICLWGVILGGLAGGVIYAARSLRG